MKLGEFLQDRGVDLESLAQIRKRVYVVGRFNNEPVQNSEPQIFLFTNRDKELTSDFRSLFHSIGKIDYDKFVELVRPRVAERQTKGAHNRFVGFELCIPSADNKENESSYVLDRYNWFFQRAVQNCRHSDFTGASPGLPRMLETTETQRGATILQQIRSYLEDFCVFQKESPRIADCIASLLDTLAGEHGLPYFAAGGALPGGFLERLMDFLYQENMEEPFATKGLDFKVGPWTSLSDPQSSEGLEMFSKVIGAFRDALAGQGARQYNRYSFRGRTLGEHAESSIPTDLRESFRRARDSYNGLRQILRSKVLLSMVLEWLLSGYKTVLSDELNGLLKDDAHEVILKAILSGRSNVVAEPVRRPSVEQRRKFRNDLGNHFESLISCVLADDGDLERLVAELDVPSEMQKLILEIRTDPKKVEALREVSGGKMVEVRQGFVRANRIMLTNVLCPVLYQDPSISSAELRDMARSETITTYLTSVMLNSRNEDELRKIGTRNQQFFASNLKDERDGSDGLVKMVIQNTDEISAVLLREYSDLLCSNELRRQLEKGLNDLAEAFDLQKGLDSSDLPGAGKLVVIHRHDGKGAAEKTKPEIETVTVGLQKSVEAILEAHHRPAPLASDASVAVEAPRKVPAAARAAKGVASKVPIGNRQDSGEVQSDFAARALEICKELKNPKRESSIKDLAKDVTTEMIRTDSDLVEKSIPETLKAFNKLHHLIYTRYTEHRDSKQSFRNSVEKMTLLNLLLQFQKELRIGDKTSHLYRLLIDLVMHLDSEHPDPADFIREKSLTAYFDLDHAADGPNAITELFTTLEVQGNRSLKNIEAVVSELHGVKYLMDKVRQDSQAEIVIVNASAKEFLAWVDADNFTPNGGRGRLRPEISNNGDNGPTLFPGVIYMTDSAFGQEAGQVQSGKRTWLEEMGSPSTRFTLGDFRVVMPPIVCSTGVANEKWLENGEEILQAGSECPCPLMVVGPSPYLNEFGDGFSTRLPAGYLFCAHFLGSRDLKVGIKAQPFGSKGRLRALGRGAAPMAEFLDEIHWGSGQRGDDYSFAADWFLYLLSLIWGTVLSRPGAPKPTQFFDQFFHLANNQFPSPEFASTEVLDRAMLNGKIRGFYLGETIGAPTSEPKDKENEGASPERARLHSVCFAHPPSKTWMDKGVEKRQLTDVNWFNRLREKAEL